VTGGFVPDAVIGVISDTHGTLDARVARAFSGVDRIVHAGDIGSAEVLLELETIAPVTAVLGNTDHEIHGFTLALAARITVAGVGVLVTHVLRMSEITPQLPGGGVVISGHTHMPLVDLRGGVLFVNPGAAFRSRLPGGQRTVAMLTISQGQASARIVEF
jgi:putative phosphoesterase